MTTDQLIQAWAAAHPVLAGCAEIAMLLAFITILVIGAYLTDGAECP